MFKLTYKQKFLIIFLIVGFLTQPISVFAQDLESPSYSIKDPSFIGSSGISDSGTNNLSLLSSFGDFTSDARLESGNYALGVGFPNGIMTNVPLVNCFEATSDDSVGGEPDTECNGYPLTAATGGNDIISGDGLQGICGSPGCYDKLKIEIGHQGNPIDTLYLVRITDEDLAIDYYVQSDNTIDTTYDIADYQTICQLEGLDTRTGSGCVNSGDPEWNQTLQSYNVLGLRPEGAYSVNVRALQGDFTEGPFSPDITPITLEYPALVFDIDIADSGGMATDTDAPHIIQLGDITATTVTATDRIWVDSGTNNSNGLTVSVENDGLSNGSHTIPSTSEDLNVDAGGDGGYGLKIETITEGPLGPLISNPIYQTAGPNEVGAIGITPTTIFYTQEVPTDRGPVSSGRVGIMVKAKAASSTPPGSYIDEITFTIIANP